MRSISIVAAILLGITFSAAGQSIPGAEGTKADVALIYQSLRSNTQPGVCGCFDLNGVGLSASWRVHPGVAAVIEGDAGFANNGPGTGDSITLFSGVAGLRYRLPLFSRNRRAPGLFAEAMAGAGRAGGGIAGDGDHGYGFVGRAGGGFDERIGGPISLRFEAAYVPSTFANGTNDRQNNLLIAAGVVYRWSGSR